MLLMELRINGLLKYLTQFLAYVHLLIFEQVNYLITDCLRYQSKRFSAAIYIILYKGQNSIYSVPNSEDTFFKYSLLHKVQLIARASQLYFSSFLKLQRMLLNHYAIHWSCCCGLLSANNNLLHCANAIFIYNSDLMAGLCNDKPFLHLQREVVLADCSDHSTRYWSSM